MFPPAPVEPEPQESPAAAAAGRLALRRPQRLDPRHVPCDRLGGGILVAVLLLFGVLALVFYALGEPRPARLLLLSAVFAALLVGLGLLVWLHPSLQQQLTSWRLSPEALEIRRGVCFRHALSVPRTRIQHIEVERGPLERRYGLATLVLYTAGHEDSEVRLAGLALPTALALRDELILPGGGDGA